MERVNSRYHFRGLYGQFSWRFNRCVGGISYGNSGFALAGAWRVDRVHHASLLAIGRCRVMGLTCALSLLCFLGLVCSGVLGYLRVWGTCRGRGGHFAVGPVLI